MLQARNRRDEGPARVGFTVSKRVGTAVERNRVRRRLKQVVNRVAPNGICLGHDYVLVGRREALSLPFDRLAEEIGQAFARVSSVAPGAPTRRGTRKSSR
jgi:ribonuclease P protein component